MYHVVCKQRFAPLRLASPSAIAEQAHSHAIIIIHKPNAPCAHPRPRPSAEVVVPLRPLRLVVAAQHALQAYAYAFDVVHGGPAGAEKVETYDACVSCGGSA